MDGRKRSAVRRSRRTGSSRNGRTCVGFAAYLVAFDICRHRAKLFEKAQGVKIKNMERYQTIGPRFLALLIDSLLIIPVSIVTMALASSFNSAKFNFVFTIGMSAIPVLYTILMHARYGQTLGKMAMKVKVLDISERPITFTQAVIRSLPQLLSVFLTASSLSSQMLSEAENEFTNELLGMAVGITYVLYFGWSIGEIISALVTEKKRALHDFIAGTVVVRTDSWSNLSINSR